MGAFRTDPSIALRGVSRPFDPIAAFSRIANLRRLQQRGQINQLQLEDLKRQRSSQQGIQKSLAGGGTRADVLARLQEVDPLTAFKLEDQFAGEAREKAKAKTELTKAQLENTLAIYDIVGREAGSLKAAEERDISDEALQIMYANSLAQLPPEVAAKLPQKYERGMADEAIAESISVSQQAKNLLRKMEIDKKIPGLHVPFSPDVEAQKRRLARPTRPPARDIRNREALMIEATATDYLTEANGDPDEALALLEEELRLPNASAEFRRLASKIRNRIRERVRPGRSRRSTEGDRLKEILGPLEQ